MTYPLMLDVTGRRVLVAGGGQVALRRVRALLAAGAVVTGLRSEKRGTSARATREVAAFQAPRRRAGTKQ